jgi:hypothetical protein
MKHDSNLRLLANLQITLALLLAAFCAWHIHATRVLNRQAFALAQSAHNRRAYDLLLTASIEYAGRVPAIHPVLRAVGVTITTNAPANKPKP